MTENSKTFGLAEKKKVDVLVKFLEYGANLAYKIDNQPDMKKIVENIPYFSDADYEHKLDIIYPDYESETYPFIINIHGGGFGVYSKDGVYRNYGLRLAQNQFAVVNINFRLSTHATYPSQVKDILGAIRFLQKNHEKYSLDVNRVFLSGDSSGAYMAAMASCIMNDPTLQEYYEFYDVQPIRALALNCGLYDFTTFMEKDVRFPLKKEIVSMLFGTTEYKELDVFRYTSVLEYMNDKFPPTYIMDTQKRSFDQEGMRLASRLEELGVPYKTNIYERKLNLPHAFYILSKYEQSHEVLGDIFDFFNQYCDTN